MLPNIHHIALAIGVAPVLVLAQSGSLPPGAACTAAAQCAGALCLPVRDIPHGGTIVTRCFGVGSSTITSSTAPRTTATTTATATTKSTTTITPLIPSLTKGAPCTTAAQCLDGAQCVQLAVFPVPRTTLSICLGGTTKSPTTTTSVQPATTTTAAPSNVPYGGYCTDSNQCSGSLYCVNNACDF